MLGANQAVPGITSSSLLHQGGIFAGPLLSTVRLYVHSPYMHPCGSARLYNFP